MKATAQRRDLVSIALNLIREFECECNMRGISESGAKLIWQIHPRTFAGLMAREAFDTHDCKSRDEVTLLGFQIEETTNIAEGSLRVMLATTHEGAL